MVIIFLYAELVMRQFAFSLICFVTAGEYMVKAKQASGIKKYPRRFNFDESFQWLFDFCHCSYLPDSVNADIYPNLGSSIQCWALLLFPSDCLIPNISHTHWSTGRSNWMIHDDSLFGCRRMLQALFKPCEIGWRIWMQCGTEWLKTLFFYWIFCSSYSHSVGLV